MNPVQTEQAGAARRVCLVNYFAWGVIADLEGPDVHIGGEEVQHTLLSRYLARSGYEVISLVGDFGQTDRQHIGGVEVRKTFPLSAGLPGVRFFYPRLTSTWAALKDADADVYYVSCAGSIVGIVAEFCRQNRRRFVFRTASDSDCAPDTLLVSNARDRWLYRYGIRHADCILVQTEKQAELLKQNYGLDSTVAGMFSDLPGALLDYAERKTDLLWLANMRTLKRPEWFIDVVRQLPELRCEMAGGEYHDAPELYRRVQQASQSLGNLVFHGQVPFGTTRSLFRNARVFVNTSELEGFPNTYLQAWANGLPVVATFDPDGLIASQGLGVVAKDVAGIVAGVTALLGSETEWRACSQRCRAYVESRLAPEIVAAPYQNALFAS